MTKNNLEILTNIIGGVESGGQVYGKRDYGAYAAPLKNSPNEVTCTLGWAQNYGNNARKLVQRIFEKNKTAFRKVDTAQIETKMKKDWVKTKWTPTAAEKKALVAIITTKSGKTVQDEMFTEVLKGYIEDAKAFGVKNVGAQMMWCEIQHLGGLSAAKRIFKKSKKPYTVDGIMETLLLDQEDKTNDNQVGDKVYQSRHECCAKWINKYVTTKTKTNETVGVTADEILNIMAGWVGLSRSAGTHKPIVDIYNSHTPLARGYTVSYQDSYCDATVSAAFIKAGAVDLIGGTECGVEEHIQIFKQKGIWQEDGTVIPEKGYICCYNWDTTVQPNDGYADHIGIVESVDHSAKHFIVIEGNMNGGVVGRRTVPFGWGQIRGFAIPKYAEKSKNTSKKTETVASSGTQNQDEVLFVGQVTGKLIDVRTWAGEEYPNITSYPKLALGNLVDVMNYTQKAADGTSWYFVQIHLPDGKTCVKGFVPSKYIQRAP